LYGSVLSTFGFSSADDVASADGPDVAEINAALVNTKAYSDRLKKSQDGGKQENLPNEEL